MWCEALLQGVIKVFLADQTIFNLVKLLFVFDHFSLYVYILDEGNQESNHGGSKTNKKCDSLENSFVLIQVVPDIDVGESMNCDEGDAEKESPT